MSEFQLDLFGGEIEVSKLRVSKRGGLYMNSADKKTGKTIYENVKYICLQKGIRISDVEKGIGSSPGYLSRTAAHSMPCGKLISIGNLLDISLDELTDENYIHEHRKNEITARIESLKEEMESLKRELEQLVN